MKKVLFDSYAVLVYLQDEPGAARVRELLEWARQGEQRLVMQKINLGEVFYQVWRRSGAVEADEFLLTFRLCIQNLKGRPPGCPCFFASVASLPHYIHPLISQNKFTAL